MRIILDLIIINGRHKHTHTHITPTHSPRQTGEEENESE